MIEEKDKDTYDAYLNWRNDGNKGKADFEIFKAGSEWMEVKLKDALSQIGVIERQESNLEEINHDISDSDLRLLKRIEEVGNENLQLKRENEALQEQLTVAKQLLNNT